MSKPKKFGAFAGVFTPSILTILGVIMYMRLGWVVGEAGLISALVIILISHVISLTTGLSISSIATDKKIKTGGIYYMLSRSLGLPMGGSIGITLFVGTALSISLYLVGFAESFLSVDVIRNFLHLEQNTNSYRIIGTASIVILVTIAFISTSLAIKTQFYILGAIALSLISIVIGFFTHSELAPDSILLTPSRNNIPLTTIFAIFFPAVTGFTAGVAMSGDLKDPKKSIPSGTMLAIAVGFVVYVGFAIALAFLVNRDLLVNDYNFLMKVAFFSPLVLTGIWGATLSSALGGILGGPRILQAISADKITPKIFAKGYGATNEPRNALILVFLIAEGGVLIGELDLIAEVVSMFYLASYGFINIAYFLESWASTDFRPTFKINRYIGLVGFIASFGVMFQLNMLSMFVALIIMLGIFFYLSKKQLSLDVGDVWQSVWLSIVRIALQKMDKRTIERRNWQPNIILFSGGTERRPHLIEFGKSLVGKYGMLSNFDLHKSNKDKYLFPKHLQSVPSDEIAGRGVFTRRKTCSNIYLGIETIVSTYGFSGIEPNTVLMGWARQSSDPVRFAGMIRKIAELDVNLVLIDYDKRFGYGKYEVIDIWWRGTGSHGNLAITLMKFLWSSKDWREAKLRLLIVNSVNDDAPRIRKKAEETIDNLRIDAEIKVINNQIEDKPFYDIIRQESLKSDLIILGIPEIEQGKEQEFVDKTSKLMLDIGTVVLINAASQFRALNFGTKVKVYDNNEAGYLKNIIARADSTDINLPDNTVAAESLVVLHEDFGKLNFEFHEKYLTKIFSYSNKLTNEIEDEITNIVTKKFDEFTKNTNSETSKQIIYSLDKVIGKTKKYLSEYGNELIDNQYDLLQEAISFYLKGIDDIFLKIPEYRFYTYGKEKLVSDKQDGKSLYRFKRNKRLTLKLTGKPIKYKVKYKKLVAGYIPGRSYLNLFETGEKFGTVGIQNIVVLVNLVKEFRVGILELQSDIVSGKISNEKFEIKKQNIFKQLDIIKSLEQESSELVYKFLSLKTVEKINEMSEDIKQINVNKLVKSSKENRRLSKEYYDKVIEIPEQWKTNQHTLYRVANLELMLIEFENKLNRLANTALQRFSNIIGAVTLKNLIKLEQFLETYKSEIQKNLIPTFECKLFEELPDKETLFLRFRKALDINSGKIKYLIDKFPETIEIFTNESFNDLSTSQFLEVETINVRARQLLDYIIQEEFIQTMLSGISEFPETIVKIESNARNIIRLITFTFFDAKGEFIESKENTPEKIIKLIDNQIEKVKQLQVSTKELEQIIDRKVAERLTSVSDKITLYSFTKLARNFKDYKSKKDKQKRLSYFKNKAVNISNFINNQVNKMWYRHSEALIIKKQIQEAGNNSYNKVNETLSLLESISVPAEILDEIPFYYQQLFLRKNNYNNEFWYGRKNELELFGKAIQRYKAGYHGAVIVIGESNSGKTFLTNYAVHKFMPEARVYTVEAHLWGTADSKLFKSKLAQALLGRGTYSRIFGRLQSGSVIIIEDLELWWEKSENGNETINKIIEIIEKYGNKFIFVLNVNVHSFRIINKLSAIEKIALNIVDCKPYNAEELKEIVLFRHNSGGMKLNINGKSENNLRQTDFAKLFAKHFIYSGGNIGITLLSWMSNIKSVEKNTIFVKTPLQPDISVLDNLSTEDNIILLQFILHKRMTINKLERILLQSEEQIISKINYLKRSGIIVEEVEQVYELNRFLYVFIKKKLEEIEML